MENIKDIINNHEVEKEIKKVKAKKVPLKRGGERAKSTSVVTRYYLETSPVIENKFNNQDNILHFYDPSAKIIGYSNLVGANNMNFSRKDLMDAIVKYESFTGSLKNELVESRAKLAMITTALEDKGIENPLAEPKFAMELNETIGPLLSQSIGEFVKSSKNCYISEVERKLNAYISIANEKVKRSPENLIGFIMSDIAVLDSKILDLNNMSVAVKERVKHTSLISQLIKQKTNLTNQIMDLCKMSGNRSFIEDKQKDDIKNVEASKPKFGKGIDWSLSTKGDANE